MNRPAPLACAFTLLLCAATAYAGDWPFFRGPTRDGKAPADAKPPLEWSKEKNVKWRTPLPGPGNSSPIVTGDRVFLTSAEDRKGTRRSLYCFNRADGKQLWVKTVTWQQADPSHATNPYCASTPATDGRRVIAWHGSAGLYCYDLDGNQLWNVDLGTIRHIWGYASSPLIHAGRVYLNAGPGARSFVVCLDAKSGERIWQTDEPGGAEDKSPETKNWIGSWSTGLIAKVDGQEQLLVFQPRHVNAYDLADGHVLWTCGGAGDLAYSDVMLGDGIGVAMAGYGGAAIGFKLGGSGDTTNTHRLWRLTQKNPQRIGSGIILGDHLFNVSEPQIQCFDIKTGKELWNHKIGGHSFWSSIVYADGRCYATSQKGTTFVFTPDPAGWKPLATNDLDEHTNATPAIADNQIFFRTDSALYCIESK